MMDIEIARDVELIRPENLCTGEVAVVHQIFNGSFEKKWWLGAAVIKSYDAMVINLHRGEGISTLSTMPFSLRRLDKNEKIIIKRRIDL